MKRVLLFVLAVFLGLLLVACSSSSTTQPTNNTPQPPEQSSPAPTPPVETPPAEPSEEPVANGEGNLGDYHVRITGWTLDKDYSGNDVIILSYDFTNNSDDAANAMFSLHFALYQDGVELESAFMIDGDYDSGSSMKDIKPGVTLACQSAFELSNTASPVEVEVSELISFSKNVIAYTIDLTDLG